MKIKAKIFVSLCEKFSVYHSDKPKVLSYYCHMKKGQKKKEMAELPGFQNWSNAICQVCCMTKFILQFQRNAKRYSNSKRKLQETHHKFLWFAL